MDKAIKCRYFHYSPRFKPWAMENIMLYGLTEEEIAIVEQAMVTN